MSNTFVRIKSVKSQVSMSPSNIWDRVAKGTFPKPIKLSPRVTVWRQSDIDDFIKDPEKYAELKVHGGVS